MPQPEPTRFFRLEVQVDGRAVRPRGHGFDLFVTDDDASGPVQQAIVAARLLQRLRPQLALQLVDRGGRVVWSDSARHSLGRER